MSTSQRYRLRNPATGREIVLQAEPGEIYLDRDDGEALEVVGQVLPLAPLPSSRLPWAVQNLRFCSWCDQLAQKDLNDCPTCGRRMEPLGPRAGPVEASRRRRRARPAARRGGSWGLRWRKQGLGLRAQEHARHHAAERHERRKGRRADDVDVHIDENLDRRKRRRRVGWQRSDRRTRKRRQLQRLRRRRSDALRWRLGRKRKKETEKSAAGSSPSGGASAPTGK